MINADGTKTWGMKWAHGDDPVFEVILDVVIDYPNGDKLPGIWITEPIFNDEGRSDGRTYTMAYPYADHEFSFPGDDDEDGSDALFYGGGYYDRFLQFYPGDKIALARSTQVSSNPLPAESCDVPVDFIVTDSGVWHCR